jgi:prepilin-type N-terminal cleavage/methylation domain-containing protein
VQKRRIEKRCGTFNRPGFTVIELLVAIVIAGILGGVSIPQISRYTSRRAAINARDAFVQATAQARAAAIQAGEDVQMQVDRTNDRVVLTLLRDGTTIGTPLDLRNGPVRAAIAGTGTFVCTYTPRGFMLPDCTNNVNVGHVVQFTDPAGTQVASAEITLGGAKR